MYASTPSMLSYSALATSSTVNGRVIKKQLQSLNSKHAPFHCGSLGASAVPSCPLSGPLLSSSAATDESIQDHMLFAQCRYLGVSYY